jgi:hypothetical protein
LDRLAPVLAADPTLMVPETPEKASSQAAIAVDGALNIAQIDMLSA